MSAKPSKELLAYAFIAQGYGASGSALDGVSQLLGHIVSQRHGQVFSPKDIAADAGASLGLDLPPLVVESLVPSLVGLGALEQITSADGVAVYKCKRVQEATYSVGEAEIDNILKDFRQFATSLLSEHGLSADSEELDSAFLGFLVTADFLSSWLQSDKSEFRGNILSLKRDQSLSDEIRLHRSLDTICALFTQEAFAKNKDLFEKLVEISWGAVIVEVVTALQVGASGQSGGLSDLTVFVDTPILLDLIELGEEEQHKYAIDLFALLNRSGAKVATFSHVVEEMRAAVETTLSRYARGEPFSGPMSKRLRAERGYELFARQTIAQLESKLNGKGVEIVPDAEFETPDIAKYFPEGNVDGLRSRVGELHKNVERRDRDAKSIAYVIRMRRGLTASPVSLSKYVFVTRNVALCKISVRYSQSENIIARGTAPPSVTDRQLAGVLWFCSGAPESEGVSLTRQKIIANCANAVAPRLDVVSKMGQVLFEHKQERLLEYEALMRDQRAALCLTRETLNVATLVDADQAEQLLEKMKQELSAEQREEFEKEKNTLIENYEREKLDLEAQLQQSSDSQTSEKERADEADRNLKAVETVIAGMREAQAGELSNVKGDVDRLKAQISGLASNAERARNAVMSSTVQEVRLVAIFSCVCVIVLYALLTWLVQSFGGVKYVVAISVFLSIIGFWLMPEYVIHPLIRWYLKRDAKNRVKRIQGISGVQLDADEIVEAVLSDIRLSPRKKSG